MHQEQCEENNDKRRCSKHVKFKKWIIRQYAIYIYEIMSVYIKYILINYIVILKCITITFFK